jgi:hypothetical protein
MPLSHGLPAEGKQGSVGAQGPRGETGDVSFMWPVGSVFLSVVATDPNALFGFGTWARLGNGRAIVGVDEQDADFDTAKKESGAKTVTLTEAQIPSHTHVQNPHSHTYGSITATTGAVSAYEHGAIDTSSTAAENSISVNAATATNQNTGGGLAHANVQPSIAIYIWERTA